MKHFRLKVLATVLLAAGLILAFSWIVNWQNYKRLSGEASKEKPLTREAVNYTLNNLARSWADYEKKIANRYETEAVFASLALQSVIDEENMPEEENQENGIVISIQDGELSSSSPMVRTLGLDPSLFQKRRGSFAAPDEPSTFVAYSRIGKTSGYYVEWYEDTVLPDLVRETIDIPGILKSTEITYDVSAMFVSGDPDSKETSDILYRNELYFSNCESLEDLGLTREDLKKNDAKTSGTLRFEDSTFTYVSGESELPAGYVLLLDPVPNLYAKAFEQAGYMDAALIILVVTLLVAGLSLYPYVRKNILTPDEEKNYRPSHVRSVTILFGVLGLLVTALSGMFGYALNGVYDDVVRGRDRLAMMDDSISMYMERYSQNMQSFHEIYMEYGTHIAEFLDTYPKLRDAEVLSTLAESISASSITLYDSKGRETVSSGPWISLELGTEPDSSTTDFRRILKGVPSIIHDLDTDEVTGLSEMRLGIRIRDDQYDDRYGVMLLSVDVTALTDHDIDPEKSVRQVFHDLSDTETTLWIADAKTGQILVSDTEGLEGENIAGLGLGGQDLKGSLVKILETEEGDCLVTSSFMETSGILEWTKAPEGLIAYYRGPKTFSLSGMFSLVSVGCILFCAIYGILAWIILTGYTDEFFNAYKQVKGSEDPKKKLNPLHRMLAATAPLRRGTGALEITLAFFLLQVFPVVKTNLPATKTTVYHYISVGDWERGFNLFAIAATLLLLSKVILLVIGFRLLMAICAYFAGSKGKTIFRLLASVLLYIALFFFLIKTCEYLGFSQTAIAAGMGSLALATSLGAQNFVADIFAGLTYVFEGTVHAGDIVQVTVMGSPVIQGKILEVGVRCLRILTHEGNLITCNNRDIRTITNSTQMNSRIICEISVSSGISADELEEMLQKELPEIGRTDRRILSGPVYNGIIALGDGRMTLSVSAECSEEDYFYVRDKLNASMQRILREHGYSI